MLLRSYEMGVDAPTLLALGNGAFIAAWNEELAEAGPLDIDIDGVPAERCRASLRLPGSQGGTRHILAFRVPGRSRGELSFERDGENLTRLIVDETRANDPTSLLFGLDAAARTQLLGFVLGICRGAFRLGDAPQFIAFARALAEAAQPKEGSALAALASLTPSQALYALGADFVADDQPVAYLIGPQRVADCAFSPFRAGDGGGRTILVAPRFRLVGTMVVIIGRSGGWRGTLAATDGVPSVAALAERGGLRGAERRYVLRCLGRLADDDPEAESAARALQIFAPEEPRALVDAKRPVSAALELTISCGQAGVFASGWISDRHDMVRRAELVSPFEERDLAPFWLRVKRPDLERQAPKSTVPEARPGFVALLPIVEPVPVLQHALRLGIGGGSVEIRPPLRPYLPRDAREMVLRSVSPDQLNDTLLAKTLAPAAAELHRQMMAQQRTPEIVAIGPAPRNPNFSIIIPLYRNLDFLRLQIGAFSADPQIGREAELVYVLDSPEQASEVEHLLRGLHALTALPFRLVIMSANFGYAAASNTGVRAAKAGTVVLLNSDVVPVAPGWLGRLQAVIEADCRVGAVGPKLLFDDGSLQHAGLTFERDFNGAWYNTHFFKGYPRDWPAANLPREVPGVTGAAMLMPRWAFEEVGGLTEDYIIGDYEDSDLCLKLREIGFAIAYEPRAELHHFERRSIELHTGYVRTGASAYNRLLHSERWAAAMTELVERFPPSGPQRSAAAP